MQKVLIGSLLVAGTAIGAGMLALPIATAEGGVFPAWVVYFLCYLFSMSTGLLFVEIGLWLPPGANIVTMASQLLGPFGRALAWIVYIFLFYSLTIAYVAGGGVLISLPFGYEGANFWLTAAFTSFFALLVFLGTRVVGLFNAILMCGLILAYFGFLLFGIPSIHPHVFERIDFSKAFLALPIIFTSFSYQGTIPTLLTYMDRDPKKMKRAIIIGSTIPLIVYLLWDLFIKSIIPAADLVEAGRRGLTSVDPLGQFVPGSSILFLGKCFAFFALSTSLIGVTLGLLDFLIDSLKLQKSTWNRFALSLLIYIPPFLIASTNPTIFLTALGYAGGFGCAILLGLLPICMVWSGRYHKHQPFVKGRLRGGKVLLALLAVFVVSEICLEIAKELFFPVIVV
jgi:tyrosine-specific transport protein